MGNFITGLAEGAVKAAPFAAQVVAQREAKQKSDLATALAQLRQQSQDNTASINAQTQGALSLANIRHLDAETTKLGEPTPLTKNVMRGPGGQLVDLTDPDNPHTIGPPPIPRAPAAPVIGSPEWKDAEKFKASLRPPPLPSVVQGQPDANGAPSFFRVPKGSGPATPIEGIVPKSPAAAGGSASLSPEDRQKMLSQAKLDNQTMKAYEADVLAGKKHVGTAAGVAGATSDAHGGVLNNVLGVLGNTATGALDADYQKYLTAQRSYGRIMGNLQSKRYTDHQAEIERSISGLQGNDLPGTIQYKQQLRDASLADVVPSAAPPAPAGRGRGGPPPNVQHPASSGDRGGNINLGGDAEANWAAKNPPHAGETFDAYHARYLRGGTE